MYPAAYPRVGVEPSSNSCKTQLMTSHSGKQFQFRTGSQTVSFKGISIKSEYSSAPNLCLLLNEWIFLFPPKRQDGLKPTQRRIPWVSGSFPRADKVTGKWRWQITVNLAPMLRMLGSVPPLLHLSSRHGAYKHSYFTFLTFASANAEVLKIYGTSLNCNTDVR